MQFQLIAIFLFTVHTHSAQCGSNDFQYCFSNRFCIKTNLCVFDFSHNFPFNCNADKTNDNKIESCFVKGERWDEQEKDPTKDQYVYSKRNYRIWEKGITSVDAIFICIFHPRVSVFFFHPANKFLLASDRLIDIAKSTKKENQLNIN